MKISFRLPSSTSDCCKIALVLVPKMFSDLHPIKKLHFKQFSCFGACLKDSIMYSIVLACDKVFSLLQCTGYVLFMFSMQLVFCFLEMAAMHGDQESHVRSKQHLHTCESEIAG